MHPVTQKTTSAPKIINTESTEAPDTEMKQDDKDLEEGKDEDEEEKAFETTPGGIVVIFFSFLVFLLIFCFVNYFDFVYIIL